MSRLPTVRTLGAGAGVAAAMVLFAGCGSSAPAKPAAAKTFTAAGTVRLIDSGVEGGAHNCYGTGGYSDMEKGAQVVVRDAAGTSIAVGQLGGGAKSQGVICDFAFSVPNIPIKSGGIYSVEVSHRGQVSFNQSQAATLSLSLGSN